MTDQSKHRSLSFKFIASISVLLLFTLGASSIYQYVLQQDRLTEKLLEKGRSLGNFIALIAPEPIYNYNITALDRIASQVSTDDEVLFASITNPEGIPMTTFHPEQIDPETQAGLMLGMAEDEDLIVQTYPIVNQGQLLGNVIIGLETVQLRKTAEQLLLSTILIDLLIILILAAFIYIIFHFNVLRQVKNLTLGANQVTREGKLDAQLPVLSRDELGQLTSCFNRMTEELLDEQQLLQESNELLEQEVQKSSKAQAQMSLAASVFTHAREGIIITDPNARIIDVNEAFCNISGYSRDEVLGNNPKILKSNLHDQLFYQELWQTLQSEGSWSGEIWNRRKNGEVYPQQSTLSSVHNSNNELQHYVALISDISSQKQHQQELERNAHYDSLTGLPNRLLLADRLNQALTQANRNDSGLLVAYLDLDGFKEVNDLYGHDIGDKLLVAIAQRMAASVRESDTIARIGGDEFVAVLTNEGQQQGNVELLRRMLDAASQRVLIDDTQLQVTVSIGVTRYPQSTEVDADMLMRQADQAMYNAKLEGKNKFCLFDSEADRQLRGQHENIEKIRQAIRLNQLVLHYQPKVNLKTGKVTGLEALLRWQHPEEGLIFPNQFLPATEDQPVSIEIGEWVIKNVLNQLQQWQKQGQKLRVSINISAHHLQQGNFVDRLQQIMAKAPDVPPQRIELEVLETSDIDIASVSWVMADCQELGVEFALDDFGTGYSSMSYLKNLPARNLKIDQSFVRDMLEDPEDLAIVEGILGLSKAFRRKTIAEGVETDEHYETLLMLGCQQAQGYTIARPMPADAVIPWIENWSPKPHWKKIKPIQADDLQLLFSLTEHRAWVLSFKQFIHDNVSDMPELDHRICRFGKWLNKEGSLTYADNAQLKSIAERHINLHAIAQQLVEQYHKGNLKQANERLTELYEISDQLTADTKKLLTRQE